ncbi:ABC transporter permease [Paenibacillus sp. FJAT-27812]|uniref:ABC transporter permease n=1 Tax=Paenibacillus sp. FJAT-27812 TaxID=1684143 RepID=UPI0006A77780|nr:ABC transporter permease subunit [Paenibacillus sp. FJAT-27812]
MLAPGILLLLLFHVYPMTGITIAFQDFNPTKGFFGSPWVGLENFKYMFELPDVRQVVGNTLIIAIMKIVANLVVSICFALLLNEVRKVVFKRVVQTVVYFPHFISWVLLGGIIGQILSLDGLLNTVLGWFNISPKLFLASSEWFPYWLVGTEVWKEFGFSAIIFLAALTGINPTLYEAAVIDGASRWRQVWHVTLPGIATTIVLVATLALQNVLNAGFEQVLNLYNPLVYSTGDIIDTYVYRAGLNESQYELATAVGLLKSIVTMILIIISYKLASKFANYRIF